jgi:hypothetical protein
VDYLCVEGDECLSPIDGVVQRVGTAYSDPKTELGSIHIQGTGKYWPYYIKILYARADVPQGKAVTRGQHIGVCQNVAKYYGAHVDMGGGTMHNHLHMELKVLADSQLYVEVPL